MRNFSLSHKQVYFSTKTLSTNLIDLLNVFIIPPISMCAFSVKLITIIVILKINKKDSTNSSYGNMFSYMLANEIFDACLSVILTFLSIFRCGSVCNLGYDYYSKIFELIFYSYLSNVLQLLITFCEISLAIERLRAFQTNYKERFKFRAKMVIMVITSFLFNLPNYLLSRTIKPIGVLIKDNSSQLLFVVTSRDEIENTKSWTILLTILSVLRGLVLYLVIFILNLVIMYKFRKRIKIKKSIAATLTTHLTDLSSKTNFNLENKLKANNPKHETRIIKIVLSMSINYLIGNLPNSLSPIMYIIFGNRSIFYRNYAIVAVLIAMASHANYIVLYYIYNPTFKKKILELLHLIRSNTNNFH